MIYHANQNELVLTGSGLGCLLAIYNWEWELQTDSREVTCEIWLQDRHCHYHECFFSGCCLNEFRMTSYSLTGRRVGLEKGDELWRPEDRLPYGQSTTGASDKSKEMAITGISHPFCAQRCLLPCLILLTLTDHTHVSLVMLVRKFPRHVLVIGAGLVVL